MIYSGQRFSSVGMRTPGFQPSFNRFGGTPIQARQFTPGNVNRGNNFARFSGQGNRSIANQNANHGLAGTSQTRNGNNMPSNWRNHVFAQHSANWHRDWDHDHDHFWHGHRCHFFNGSWVLFDFGFYPWWGDWDYPSYYGYGYPYYPYGYDPNYNGYGPDEGQNYYSEGGYGDQGATSAVAAAQDRLARGGYYRGQIDGVMGPKTRHAIARYQSNHGLRANGELTPETLDALGLRQYASY